MVNGAGRTSHSQVRINFRGGRRWKWQLASVLAIAFAIGGAGWRADNADAALYYGLNYGGDSVGPTMSVEAMEANMEAVARSGSSYFRLRLDYYTRQAYGMAYYEQIFRLAWERNLTILPFVYGTNVAEGHVRPKTSELKCEAGKWWCYWLDELVRTFGYRGSFWAGKSNSKPVRVWEIWNEPNRGLNGPDGAHPFPLEYGEFFKRSAEIIENEQEAVLAPYGEHADPFILVGGLLSLCTEGESCEEEGTGNTNLSVSKFLNEMGSEAGLKSRLDGVGLHPYAFKGSGSTEAEQIKSMVEKVELHVENARSTVSADFGSGKPIWITELGWPRKSVSSNQPAVSEAAQATLLTNTFGWIKEHSTSMLLEAAMYYFYRDGHQNESWDEHTGLRTAAVSRPFTAATFRSSWYAFINITGAAPWPLPASEVIADGATVIHPRDATLHGSLNPNGLPTEVSLEYGTTTGYGTTAEANYPGYRAKATPVSVFVSGLTPSTAYHYRLHATNENHESSYSSDFEVQTPPALPIIATGDPTGVASTKATLNGTVNPNGYKTTYWFKYGPTTAYGFETGGKTLEGETLQAVSASLEGLEFGGTIHYQLNAKSSQGEAIPAEDRVFTPGWLQESNPKPTSAVFDEMQSVSCKSRTFCIGVGIYETSSHVIVPLAERWDGANWEMTAPKVPGSSIESRFEGVSCVSTTDCTAVGYYWSETKGLPRLTLIEHWNGSEWSIQTSKNPEPEGINILESVSCTASNACTAVGGGVIERWTGTEWSLQSSEGKGILESVSCSTSTDCLAVGHSLSGETYVAVAEHWNGTKWSATAATKGVAGSKDTWFRGVSCVSTTACFAVGYTANGLGESDYKQPLAEKWNGSAWELETTPTFGSGQTFVNGVSCSSTTSCIAAGYYPRRGSEQPFAMRWNGATWAEQAPPSPSHDLLSLTAVSCVSSTECIAVGYSRFTYMGSLSEGYYTIPAPTVVTNVATAVTETEASLKGTINANDTEAKYFFEYGTTAAYGSKTVETGVSGVTPLEVSKPISGLVGATKYHFRIVGKNAVGTTYGADTTFETVGIAGKLASLKVIDPFNGKAVEGSEFSKDWAALGWAGGTTPKGQDTESGWAPAANYPTINGASYKTSYTASGLGIASVVTMAKEPSMKERSVAVWLDMPTPGSTEAGYELWLASSGAGSYTVGLSKWAGGTQTVLAEKAKISIANGNSFGIVDEGSTVSAWFDTGSGFTKLLSAADLTYSGGQVGVQAAASVMARLTNFKAGVL